MKGKFHDPLEGYYMIKFLRITNFAGYASKVALFAVWMYLPRYFGVHINGTFGTIVTITAALMALASGYSYGFIAGVLFGASTISWWPLVYYAVIRGIGFIFYDRLLSWMTKPYKPANTNTPIPNDVFKPPKERELENML